jgi:hypothetical protein
MDRVERDAHERGLDDELARECAIEIGGIEPGDAIPEREIRRCGLLRLDGDDTSNGIARADVLTLEQQLSTEDGAVEPAHRNVHPFIVAVGRRGYRVEMTYEKDPRVDAYIDALPEWQQAICREVRDLVHEADPEVVETIKRTRQPYFVLDGNVAALLAAKDHVNVFLYDGAIVPDPEGIITAGHDNTTARQISIRPGEQINARALKEMLRQIIANNRAGGWRKIKAGR